MERSAQVVIALKFMTYLRFPDFKVAKKQQPGYFDNHNVSFTGTDEAILLKTFYAKI